ncbi:MULTISPECIES: winged helix-turn-helix transcriptional regulator [Clostridium]|uniref:winged helix-turn-helix transcriptional regulator n=1 Tax=Clostridium TaxID=1485 RepID=UPI000826D0FA|nr:MULTISPECIES: helix-turn-helix domain-containing protein [Clostridium]PJI08434.1 transcriptional regulator [Clostridium sp. CT7]
MKENLFGVCPYVTAQKVLAGKWTISILHILSVKKSMRFNELQRMMPEKMTHATLSRQLKYLEKENMIIRKDYRQIPPRVEYSLSEIGEKFKSVLDELEKWGKDYISFMNGNS